ncbi:MAG: hypothetical protein GVY36_02860 [Verrucomicrobia bacterium]|nr:hypothetical protein [Verrucomicrobiota bacterium]
MKDKIKVIYIFGPGHCGSTLLSLLLDGHTEILSLSEVKNISKNKAKIRENTFWGKVIKRCEEVRRFELDDLDSGSTYRDVFWIERESLDKWALANKTLFEYALKESKCSVVVDSSKNFARCYLFHASDYFDLHLINLVRNGKGVYNSYLKKYNDSRGIKKWVKSCLMGAGMELQAAKSIRVRYEDMCDRTNVELNKICSIVGLEYSEVMLHPETNSFRGIGGNRMRYGENIQIELDESWKEELSFSQKVKFNILAGPLNKLYGY